MTRSATVDDYTASLPEAQQRICDLLLPLIEQAVPGTGAVWHGHPVWSLGAAPGKAPVCFVKAYAGHLAFGLWRGQEVADPSGRLAAGARSMASVRLRSTADVDAALFAGWLAAARDLEQAVAG
ncbi:DUF1801 domain-containing protein [Kitasatospora paranensis]|uniref:DUF1801 domain-containing protein n=1 Tax=Kitasatospora paranensis TaxID=258053 RepID=A0ABW2FSS2_9ACTN